jgi:hypothetical protein
MTETVINTKALPEFLLKLIQTEKVKVYETEGTIQIVQIEEPVDYIDKLRGSLKAYPEMSVDKFLERKHDDKELDL